MGVQKFNYRRAGGLRGKGDLKAVFDHVRKTGRPLLIVDGRFEGVSNTPYQPKLVNRERVVATLLPTKVGDTPDFGQFVGRTTLKSLKELFKKDGVFGSNSVQLWGRNARQTVMVHAGLPKQGNLVFVPTARTDRNSHFELRPLTADQSFGG